MSQSSGVSSETVTGQGDETKQLRQPSRQEIIAAQRAATRANQRAILSAQSNSERGVDIVLQDNAMLRSSRYDADDKMRYSYVEPDGETYDISDIVEEEWRGDDGQGGNDLLKGVLVRDKDGLGDRINRVLNKVKDGKVRLPVSGSSRDSHTSMRSMASEYSLDSPAGASNTFSDRTSTPTTVSATLRATSPMSKPPPSSELNSIKSRQMTNDDVTMDGHQLNGLGAASELLSQDTSSTASSGTRRKRPFIPKDEFGVAHMLAIIEFSGKAARKPLPPLDPVEGLLFGRPVDQATLHPQIRDIYSSSFKKLEDMDKVRVKKPVANCDGLRADIWNIDFG
jgi:hypothetical protein